MIWLALGIAWLLGALGIALLFGAIMKDKERDDYGW